MWGLSLSQTPQSRKQHLQLGVIMICLVCLLPTRLVLKSQKWRFPPFPTSDNNSKRSSRTDNKISNNNNTAECRYFPEAIFQLTNALREHPEETAVRPWHLTTPFSKKYPPWHFPGLSSALLSDTVRGKRMALVGDSTLFSLERWIQTLLTNTSGISQELLLDSLLDMDMTAANYAINPEMDDQVGWSNNAPAESRLEDGTVVVWDGRRKAPGEAVCNFDAVWQHIRNLRPHILVVNFGLHWLHLMGQGRDVPLCSLQSWLQYEEWLATALRIARESGVRLVLFKTTNAICVDRFWGDYSDGVALYDGRGRDALDVHTKCHHMFQALIRDNTGLPAATTVMFGPENITRYCEKAVLDEYGVKDLNHRLFEFVRKEKQKQKRQQQAASSSNNNDASSIAIDIYNDHDLQSCAYSEPNDGRHYHPLNLMRVRLLANMIQCLYPRDEV